MPEMFNVEGIWASLCLVLFLSLTNIQYRSISSESISLMCPNRVLRDGVCVVYIFSLSLPAMAAPSWPWGWASVFYVAVHSVDIVQLKLSSFLTLWNMPILVFAVLSDTDVNCLTLGTFRNYLFLSHLVYQHARLAVKHGCFRPQKVS